MRHQDLITVCFTATLIVLIICTAVVICKWVEWRYEDDDSNES